MAKRLYFKSVWLRPCKGSRFRRCGRLDRRRRRLIAAWTVTNRCENRYDFGIIAVGAGTGDERRAVGNRAVYNREAAKEPGQLEPVEPEPPGRHHLQKDLCGRTL
jgi:hypothetical protein